MFSLSILFSPYFLLSICLRLPASLSFSISVLSSFYSNGCHLPSQLSSYLVLLYDIHIQRHICIRRVVNVYLDNIISYTIHIAFRLNVIYSYSLLLLHSILNTFDSLFASILYSYSSYEHIILSIHIYTQTHTHWHSKAPLCYPTIACGYMYYGAFYRSITYKKKEKKSIILFFITFFFISSFFVAGSSLMFCWFFCSVFLSTFFFWRLCICTHVDIVAWITTRYTNILYILWTWTWACVCAVGAFITFTWLCDVTSIKWNDRRKKIINIKKCMRLCVCYTFSPWVSPCHARLTIRHFEY